jgi:hypothetical protein
MPRAGDAAFIDEFARVAEIDQNRAGIGDPSRCLRRRNGGHLGIGFVEKRLVAFLHRPFRLLECRQRMTTTRVPTPACS